MEHREVPQISENGSSGRFIDSLALTRRQDNGQPHAGSILSDDQAGVADVEHSDQVRGYTPDQEFADQSYTLAGVGMHYSVWQCAVPCENYNPSVRSSAP